MSSAAKAATVLLVTLVLPLAGCSTVRPLYGTEASAAVTSQRFAYADPGNTTDQALYTELRLRLGPQSDSADALRVAVSTSSGARAITRTNVSKPTTTYEMTVSATVTVIDAAGKVVFSGVRKSSALYETTGQALADVAAANEAADRAARAVADPVRLAILGALAT